MKEGCEAEEEREFWAFGVEASPQHPGEGGAAAGEWGFGELLALTTPGPHSLSHLPASLIFLLTFPLLFQSVFITWGVVGDKKQPAWVSVFMFLKGMV